MIRVHGYLGTISEQLRQEADEADLVVGGRRHLDALAVPEARRQVLGLADPAVDRIRALPADARVVVIASGDPLFFGIVRRLRQSGLDVEVVPEVTSVQAAFAAVAVPWDDAQIVSAHSHGLGAAVRVARNHPKVAVLTAPGRGVRELAEALRGAGKTYVLAARMGEADQRVDVLTEEQALALDADEVPGLHVVLVLDYRPDDPRVIGVAPEIAGDAEMPADGDPRPGDSAAADGSDREPIIGHVYATTRARATADRIDEFLGVSSKRYGGKVAAGLAAAWGECDLIVSHVALGATARMIAPMLANKKTDPGVVVVDEAARFAIPLSGGHIGGANELARRIAEATGATAVVSTATDAIGLPALDQLGWAFSGDVAPVTAAIIEGQPVDWVRQRLWRVPPMPAHVRVTGPCEQPTGEPDEAVPAVARVVVTDEIEVPESELPTVVLRPDSLVVGMGCNKGTGSQELRDLLEATLAEAGLAIESVTALYSADVKVGEKGLIKLAAELGVPYRVFDAATLDAQEAPNTSELVRAEVGTGSVSEAAVLAAGADLVVPKHKTQNATCAIGRLPARGVLHIVGLGPGARDLLTPRAREAVRNANMVVGYGPYVRQVRDLISPNAEVMATKMGTEEQRTAAAIDGARRGLDVAFVCGGDPAIYAMASPALEMGTDGIDIDVIPGVTAELAVSAILGAPLGHDHATISLSDLHTDWDLICRRVRSAAEGDFVITFYNPRSRTRIHHLPDALAIIAEYRGPDTPVACVAQAERRQQKVTMSTLAQFKPEWVDMNTMVIVGSDTTKFVTSGDGRRMIVTPRDYHWMEGHVSGEKRLNYRHQDRPKMSRAEYRGQTKER
ncbi:precorrin-3B C(17)-methyltransferase [Propionibacterium australiense]|uniref:Precorrin-3B C(17)-methyltransferase n=1 Tax=Propionibacterium australiense TaxID=119981 RepID=A0A8B3FTE2_9ACTN|nr:precorrin-3B C(17)-methyltransferase [Propionibacterium australiense]RLP10819.1 precorrin-3B C(17)-methyltransferase [Propionibacterium australiense]